MKKRVVIGLSGGVDSSVAAYLLKEQGYEVIAMFMKNWHDDSVIIDNECPWVEDSNDAMIVAQTLDIPYFVIDLSEEYKRDIVDYMMDAYAKGLTPNPDVLCNYHIKFGHFLSHAMKLNADYVATGHYAKVDTDGNLYKAIDPQKDQSYFLSQVDKYHLRKTLLPLGDYTKDQIRKIARDNNLITADKKDSQGLCFVGKIKLIDFLSQQLKPKAGVCIDVDTNEIVGQHKGAHFFTRGQRKGLGISGADSPYYVATKDVHYNILYVTKDKKSPYINSSTIYCSRVNYYDNWNHISDYPVDELLVQTQYHGEFRKISKLTVLPNSLIVESKNGFYAPERGQFLVLYYKNKILLSGEITNMI